MVLASKRPFDPARGGAVGIEFGIGMKVEASLTSTAMKTSVRLRIEPEARNTDGMGIKICTFLCEHCGSIGAAIKSNPKNRSSFAVTLLFRGKLLGIAQDLDLHSRCESTRKRRCAPRRRFHLLASRSWSTVTRPVSRFTCQKQQVNRGHVDCLVHTH